MCVPSCIVQQQRPASSAMPSFLLTASPSFLYSRACAAALSIRLTGIMSPSSTICLAARLVRLVRRTEPCLLRSGYLERCCRKATLLQSCVCYFWLSPSDEEQRVALSSSSSSALSALSNTRSHGAFFSSRSQSCTNLETSACGSLRPRTLTSYAIS
jgi:hypothetical protein